MRIGYARVSTAQQDLTVQRQQLADLGVEPERIYFDHGLTAANRQRPGLTKALDATRKGDIFVVTKLDRLARSVPDLHAIADELAAKGVTLDIGGQQHDPTSAVGRLLFNVLAMIAEFERDLIVQRTREGMALARERGRLKGGQPKLSRTKEAHLVKLFNAGDHTVAEIGELFEVSRATVYRAVARAKAAS